MWNKFHLIRCWVSKNGKGSRLTNHINNWGRNTYVANIRVICVPTPDFPVWCWRHDDIPLSIRVRRSLSKNTAAHRLIFKPSYYEEGAIDVDADDWVEHERASEYVVKEDSVRIGNGKVLSLVWWKDESQITDLD